MGRYEAKTSSCNDNVDGTIQGQKLIPVVVNRYRKDEERGREFGFSET